MSQSERRPHDAHYIGRTRPSAPFAGGDDRMQSFEESTIGRVPQAAGVYRLYRSGRLILVAMALSVRDALQQHRAGEHGPCTQTANAFDYQITEQPVALQRAWLAQYAAESGGKLPECNEAARKSPPR